MTPSNLSLAATTFADLEAQASLLCEPIKGLSPLERSSAATRLISNLNNLSARCKLLATADVHGKERPAEFYSIIFQIDALKTRISDTMSTSSAFTLRSPIGAGRVVAVTATPRGGSGLSAASALDERAAAGTLLTVLNPESFVRWSAGLRSVGPVTVSEPKDRPEAPLGFKILENTATKRPRPSGPPSLAKNPYVVSAAAAAATCSAMDELESFSLDDDATHPSAAKAAKIERKADAMDLDDGARASFWGVGTLDGSTVEVYQRDSAGATAVDKDRAALMHILMTVQRCTPSEKALLKQVLSNLLLVLSNDFHLLSIAANVMKTVAGIEVSHWNKEAIQLIVASLSTVRVPLIFLGSSAGATAAVPDHVIKIQALQSIAPYMMPSYVVVVLYRLIKEAGSPISKELLLSKLAGRELVDAYLSTLS